MNKWITIGLTVVFAAILLQRECSHVANEKEMKDSYNSVISFKEKENDQLKNSLDLEVAEKFIMRQNLMSEKVAKEQLKKELAGYKSINAYLKSEVFTTLKDIEAKYDSSGKDDFDGIDFFNGEYIHKDDVDKNFIRIPKTFSYKDDWTYFSGTVNKKSTMMDSLSMFNKFDAIIGYTKPDTMKFKWFKKPVPVVELKSYNPYTKINYVNNITVKNERSKVGNILTSRPAFFVYGLISGMALN